MSAILSIPELLEQEQYCVMVPCVYDCASARAAEMAGYKAILLSGGEVGLVLGDLCEEETSEEEMFFVASHVCAFSTLPLVVDCGCFGIDPVNVHRWSRRFAEAGTMALLFEDGDCPDRESYLAMIRAAVHAVRGTRCIVICRSNRSLERAEDMDYVVDLMNESMDLGAYMSMACGLHSTEKAKEIARRVKGPKFYPDQDIHDGVPEVINEEIYDIGFVMVSFHYTLKVAMASMVEYGRKSLQAGNNRPAVDMTVEGEYPGCSARPFFEEHKQARLSEQEEYIIH